MWPANHSPKPTDSVGLIWHLALVAVMYERCWRIRQKPLPSFLSSNTIFFHPALTLSEPLAPTEALLLRLCTAAICLAVSRIQYSDNIPSFFCLTRSQIPRLLVARNDHRSVRLNRHQHRIMPGHADERTPLLAAAVSEDRDTDAEPNGLTESSPLLSDRGDSAEDDSSPQRVHGRPQAQQTKDAATQSKQKRRWPSLIAMIILGTLVVIVMVLGFVVPPAVQEYVENAAVLEPTDLSVESLTADGVRARVKGTFKLDGARVTNDNARRIGRIATGIMRQLGTAETQLQLHLPHYDNALVGSAMLPPITLGLVDGQVTDLDFVADFVPGDTETARKVVNEWLRGNLDQLKVTGATALRLQSGILPLGTHNVSESMVFQGQSLYRAFAAVFFGQKTIK